MTNAERIIAIGHSMGGGAVIDWCERYQKRIHLMITLDPRVTGSKPYEKPSNVLKAINFYQKGFMPGYPVSGAENILIKTYGHTELPSMTRVFNEIIAG
jgi:alpha-beta hydrolase superfamily lysophospholipase